MEFKDFINKSDREFKDISSESLRYYNLSDGTEIEIDNPVALSVSETAHYVVFNDGEVVRIPFNPTTDVVGWVVKPGYPHVVV